MILSKPDIKYETEDIEISEKLDSEHFYPVCKCEKCGCESPFGDMSRLENGDFVIEYYCLKCTHIINSLVPIGYVSYIDLQMSGWSEFL